MDAAATVLVVDDDDAIGDLIAAVVQKTLPTATVRQARTGLSAIELFQAHQQHIQLVILDIELGGVFSSHAALSGREVCLKIRELHPTVPILPCTVDTRAAPFLEDLGCAPLFTKQALGANPLAFAARVQEALGTRHQVRVSPASLNYMLGRADAILAEVQASEQPRVTVLSQHPLLRGALVRALSGLPVQLLASVSSAQELYSAAAQIAGAHILVGTVSDIDEMRSVSIITSNPTLAVAMRQPELDTLPPAAYRAVNVMLFDQRSNAAVLLAALAALQRGERFLALPAAKVAQIVVPPHGLPTREWEVVISSLELADPLAIAAACGVDPATVETYWKRARRRTGLTREEAVCLARQVIVETLGVMPQIVSGLQRERSVGEA